MVLVFEDHLLPVGMGRRAPPQPEVFGTIRSRSMSLPRPLLGLALGSTLMATAPAAGDALGGFRVDEPFPNLVLPAVDDGRPLSIASFRGRKLVLHVWASW